MIIPAERLFWSIVEAPGVRTSGPLPAGLWALLEDDVPVNPELLWAVGTPIDAQRLLVCAALRSDLSSFATADGVLTPDRVPESVVESIDPALLNLLVGPFEPVKARKARQRRKMITAAAALAAAVLAGIGLERRASTWRQEARDLDTAAQSVLASISPSLGWTRDDLAMELMQRKERSPVELKVPGDAALAVAGLIGHWPTQIPAKPQSISASGETASVSVLVPGDAAAFIAALNYPEGWKLQEPRLVNVDKATRVNLEIRRVSP